MKEFIGKTILIHHTLGMKIKGTLIEDRSDRIVLSQTDKENIIYISHIPKKHIGSIIYKEEKGKTEEKTEENKLSGILVLSLVDKNTHENLGCYYITNGGDLQQNMDFFLSSIGRNDCAISVIGDLYSIPYETLINILGGMVIEN